MIGLGVGVVEQRGEPRCRTCPWLNRTRNQFKSQAPLEGNNLEGGTSQQARQARSKMQHNRRTLASEAV